MAKVYKHFFGSKYTGRPIGTNFVVYSTGYEQGGDYMRIRRWSKLANVGPAFFREKYKIFGRWMMDWNNLTDDQKQEYEDYETDDPKSGEEKFLDDILILGDGPEVFEDAELGGDLRFTSARGSIGINWLANDIQFDKKGGENFFFVYKKEGSAPDGKFSERIVKTRFDPDENLGILSQILANDTDVVAGKTYHYKFRITNLRIVNKGLSDDYSTTAL